MSNSFNSDKVVSTSVSSWRVVILRNQSYLGSFVYSGGSIEMIRAGVQLNCLRTAKFRDWLDIRVYVMMQ